MKESKFRKVLFGNCPFKQWSSTTKGKQISVTIESCNTSYFCAFIDLAIRSYYSSFQLQLHRYYLRECTLNICSSSFPSTYLNCTVVNTIYCLFARQWADKQGTQTLDKNSLRLPTDLLLHLIMYCTLWVPTIFIILCPFRFCTFYFLLLSSKTQDLPRFDPVSQKFYPGQSCIQRSRLNYV